MWWINGQLRLIGCARVLHLYVQLVGGICGSLDSAVQVQVQVSFLFLLSGDSGHLGWPGCGSSCSSN